MIPGSPDDPITLVVSRRAPRSVAALFAADRPDRRDARAPRDPRTGRAGSGGCAPRQAASAPCPTSPARPGFSRAQVRETGQTLSWSRALRSAHAMVRYGMIAGLPVLVTAPDTPYRRRLVRLAFLAPEIQRAIVEGRQSAGLTLAQLLKGPIPLDWSQQAARFPFAASRGIGIGSLHPAHSTAGKTSPDYSLFPPFVFPVPSIYFPVINHPFPCSEKEQGKFVRH